jgi:predicted CopG family antitoxin
MSAEYKSVRLTTEAYEMLENRKRDDETFSEAIERLAKERPISDLAGLFSDGEVEDVRSARAKSYETYADRREREYET